MYVDSKRYYAYASTEFDAKYTEIQLGGKINCKMMFSNMTGDSILALFVHSARKSYP